MYNPRTRHIRICLVALLLSQSDHCFAADWNITPAVTLAEHYTDNLFLSPRGTEEQDYVTELDPAISIVGKSRRFDFNFNYQMQNLFYQYNNDYNDLINLLQLGARAELVKKNLFLDVNGQIDQQIVSFDQRIPVDNINIGNRSEVKSLSISPYYLSDTNGMMLTDIRYIHGITLVQEGASDSVTNSVNIKLTSGREFSRLGWQAVYNNTVEKRAEGDDIAFENASLDAQYRLTNSISFLANYGYANNDYQSAFIVNNGSYWAFGFGWRPNEKLGVDAVYGNQYRSASLDWKPSQRTSLNVGWRNTDIGLNPGKTWTGAFSLKTRHTDWTARYLEDTTTTQQTQVLPDPFGPQNGSGQNSEVQQPFEMGLTNEVFVRKRGELGFVTRRAKSDLSLHYFNETRILQSSGTQLQSYGGNGAWHWRINSKTRFNVQLEYDKRSYQEDTEPDDFHVAETSFEWLLKRPLSARATYRYTEQVSTDETRSYTENRVILELIAVFSKYRDQYSPFIQ